MTRRATIVELDTRTLLTSFRGIHEQCAMCGREAVIHFELDTADTLGRDALDRVLAGLGWLSIGRTKRYCHVVCYWAAESDAEPSNMNLSSAMLRRDALRRIVEWDRNERRT